MKCNESVHENDERVCAKCGTWVYYDNGDVTYHCGCDAGWKWQKEGSDE